MSKLSNDSVESTQEPSGARLESERGVVTCVSASHTILFEQSDDRCSVCDEHLEAEDDESTEVRGRGLLVWARGDERRYEEPHLCPRCASAIGVSALQRWEIEEDEG